MVLSSIYLYIMYQINSNAIISIHSTNVWGRIHLLSRKDQVIRTVLPNEGIDGVGEREIDPSCFALVTGLIASDYNCFFVPVFVSVYSDFLAYTYYQLFMPLRSKTRPHWWTQRKQTRVA